MLIQHRVGIGTGDVDFGYTFGNAKVNEFVQSFEGPFLEVVDAIKGAHMLPNAEETIKIAWTG
jgi:hypothetical protein